MITREIVSSSILSKSGLPEADFVINPYIGCAHGCVYCYSRFMKRFTGHQEPWGEFVDIKINAGELAERELGKAGERTILLSSVTDPYQPLERKYGLTRQILKQAVINQTPISILTKSDLVLRDLDLLKQLDNCEVGVSISTLDDNLREIFEPRASSVQQRLKVLDEIKKSGIRTYAFIGPILPELTDLEALFERLKQAKVDLVMAENLNLRPSIWPAVRMIIEDRFPSLLPVYEKAQQQPQVYWEPIKEQIAALSKKYNLPVKTFFYH